MVLRHLSPNPNLPSIRPDEVRPMPKQAWSVFLGGRPESLRIVEYQRLLCARRSTHENAEGDARLVQNTCE